MLNYFMYCRKSSEDEDRQVISNESQENELQPIARRDALAVHRVIKEAASAKSSGTRLLFNQMTTAIRNGEANGILCWHPNRLSRNATDAAMLVDLMDQGKLLEIRTASQTFKNTPSDKFLLTLFCSQAKLENDNKGVDVKRGLRAKVEMGWYPGVAPLGYLNDKTKNRGERGLYNDPDRFSLVKRMWQLMLTGTYTPSRILRLANNDWGFRTRRTKKQGGTALTLSSLYHIFHNPFYYGQFEYPKSSGKWYRGKHEPMVSKAEFEKVRSILGRNGNPRPSTKTTFAYTGMIRCGECGGMITAEEKHQIICSVCRFKFVYRNRDKCTQCKTPITKMKTSLFLDYTYYHCARRSRGGCKQPSVTIAEIEKQIAVQLARIQISAEFKSWAFKYLKELHAHELISMRNIDETREKAYADCLKQLENLIKLKTSPANADGSLLSDEEYSSQRRILLEQKDHFGATQKDMKLRADQALQQSEATFEFAHIAPKRFLTGDWQVKKKILATVASNLTLKDKNLIIEAKKPFLFLDEFNSSRQPETTPFEPENNQTSQVPNPGSDTDVPIQLRELNDVRTNKRFQRMVKCVYNHFPASGPEAFGPWVWN